MDKYAIYDGYFPDKVDDPDFIQNLADYLETHAIVTEVNSHIPFGGDPQKDPRMKKILSELKDLTDIDYQALSAVLPYRDTIKTIVDLDRFKNSSEFQKVGLYLEKKHVNY